MELDIGLLPVGRRGGTYADGNDGFKIIVEMFLHASRLNHVTMAVELKP